MLIASKRFPLCAGSLTLLDAVSASQLCQWHKLVIRKNDLAELTPPGGIA
jgi:hypothetical protein